MSGRGGAASSVDQNRRRPGAESLPEVSAKISSYFQVVCYLKATACAADLSKLIFLSRADGGKWMCPTARCRRDIHNEYVKIEK